MGADAAGVLEWQGPLSPPRRNGELVFEHLWESRVFGMTMTLYERDAFAWDEFRARLIAAIGEWERAHHPDDSAFQYWECWLHAFESLLADKGLCAPAALAARVDALAARPAGHDHR
ncbi:MAG: nitrile hydratase accessory protein [Candidatus Binatia bacterium]